MNKLIFFLVIIIAITAGVWVGTKPSTSKVLPLPHVLSEHIVQPTATTQPEKPGLPVKISIPSIKVNAHIESVGLDNKNAMDVPKDVFDTAWYNLGSRPGEIGSAVIDGHFDTQTGSPAVFYDLKKLNNGDTITVTDNQGQSYTYGVTNVTSYDFTSVPLKEIFADASGKKLNLITCGGEWDKVSHNYSQRIVVYSKMQ